MDVSRELPQSVFNTQSQSLLSFLRGRNATDYLYQHQVDAVEAACQSLQGQNATSIALVVLPTGCGKTGVAVLAAYALNASRVLVITPSVKISKQIHENFCGSENRHCFLLERNIIKADEESSICPSGAYITNTSKIRQHMRDPFMVVNAHKIGGTSSVKIEDIPNNAYDLVIVDEAHHYPALTWKTLVDHFDGSRRLFITATPEYRGEPILKNPGPCFKLSRAEAVQRGIVRNIDFHEVPSKVYQQYQLQSSDESVMFTLQVSLVCI